jgi:hypothetical protein
MIASNSSRTQLSSAYTKSANAASTHFGTATAPGGTATVLATAAGRQVRQSSKVMAITVSVTGSNSPTSSGRSQARISLRPSSPLVIEILRGLACSAIGSRSVSTPFS